MSVMGCADGGTGAVEEEERLDLAGVLADTRCRIHRARICILEIERRGLERGGGRRFARTGSIISFAVHSK